MVAREMENANEKDDKYVITKVEKIVNPSTWMRYSWRRSQIVEDIGSANETLLFYGTSLGLNELVDNGFVMYKRYVSADGSFGAGLYFTGKSSQAHQYTGTTGKMLFCRDSLGLVFWMDHSDHLAHPPIRYHSVVGHRSRNSNKEYVVYRGEQCYSSEENHDDQPSGEVRSPWRHSRGYQRKGRPSHSSLNKSHHNQRHSVNMPSGAVFKISDPVLPVDTPSSSVKCKKPTLISLNPSGKLGRKEYSIIAQEMQATNERDERFNITKIQKIVKPCAWKLYTDKRSQIEEESGIANEAMLFYVSNKSREMIVKGFGDSYISHGDLGDGFYFTEHSSKAHKYSETSGQLLLCRVSLGKVKSFGYKDRSSGRPPHGYNSLRYVTRSGYSPYLVAYSADQIYPEYLITYTVQTENSSGSSTDDDPVIDSDMLRSQPDS